MRNKLGVLLIGLLGTVTVAVAYVAQVPAVPKAAQASTESCSVSTEAQTLESRVLCKQTFCKAVGVRCNLSHIAHCGPLQGDGCIFDEVEDPACTAPESGGPTFCRCN